MRTNKEMKTTETDENERSEKFFPFSPNIREAVRPYKTFLRTK